MSWLVSKETLVSEALQVLSCTGVGTLLPPGLAWSGGGKEGAMVQDPRPLKIRGCHDDDDVTMHKKVVSVVWGTNDVLLWSVTQRWFVSNCKAVFCEGVCVYNENT